MNRGKYAVSDETLTDTQWAWLRRQIIERPRWVAERVGIEQVGYLTNLRPDTPSPLLTETWLNSRP